jgi:hypothetical protein
MAKDPSARYGTAAELARASAQALGVPVQKEGEEDITDQAPDPSATPGGFAPTVVADQPAEER